MIRTALKTASPEPEEAAPQALPRDEHIAPAPRVSVQAFCETMETAAAIQSAGEDRRLGKAHVKIQMGGVAAAIEAYRGSPTPNVIMLSPASTRWPSSATRERGSSSSAAPTTSRFTASWCGAASATT
jgi:hypothetical protein